MAQLTAKNQANFYSQEQNLTKYKYIHFIIFEHSWISKRIYLQFQAILIKKKKNYRVSQAFYCIARIKVHQTVWTLTCLCDQIKKSFIDFVLIV